MEVFMVIVRKNITLKEEVIIFNDYCKKVGQTLSELLRNSALKVIKEVAVFYCYKNKTCFCTW